MNKTESSEDYLERILILQEKNGSVHSIDIAEDMNFSKASVSIAMKKLRNKNYITVDNNGCITLTQAGLSIAAKIYERHLLLTQALVSLGVPEETAKKDACKIEHDISEESFQAIKKHIK